MAKRYTKHERINSKLLHVMRFALIRLILPIIVNLDLELY